jgi:hypothetical protein
MTALGQQRPFRPILRQWPVWGGKRTFVRAQSDETWATSGFDGVQNLVQGLAPAAVLGVLYGPQLMPDQVHGRLTSDLAMMRFVLIFKLQERRFPQQ